MDAAQLVTAAMRRSGLESTRTIAKELGVSHVAVAKWLNGETCPSFEIACELAELAGLPMVSTAAEVRQTSVDGSKRRRVLRQLAQGTAVLALGALLYSFGRLDGQTLGLAFVLPIHYAQCRRCPMRPPEPLPDPFLGLLLAVALVLGLVVAAPGSSAPRASVSCATTAC